MSKKRKLGPQTRPGSEKTPKGFDSPDTRKAQRVFGTAFLLLVLLRFIATFFPKERLWGINYFAYLPMLLD